VKVPTEVFTPRRNPLVTALNDSEIVIMGGTDGENCLSDVLVYDIDKKECQKVADGVFKFTSDNNQITLVGDKVVALVFDEDDTPCLIEWSKGEDQVTVLQKYPTHRKPA